MKAYQLKLLRAAFDKIKSQLNFEPLIIKRCVSSDGINHKIISNAIKPSIDSNKSGKKFYQEIQRIATFSNKET